MREHSGIGKSFVSATFTFSSVLSVGDHARTATVWTVPCLQTTRPCRRLSAAICSQCDLQPPRMEAVNRTTQLWRRVAWGNMCYMLVSTNYRHALELILL